MNIRLACQPKHKENDTLTLNATIVIVSNAAYNILHFRKSLWQALLAEGYTVVALAPADGREAALVAAGIAFIPLPELKPVSKSPFHEWRLYRQLKVHYRVIRPAAILHFTIKPNIFGSMAANAVGISSIATITGLGTTWLNGSLLKISTKLLYRYSLSLPNAVVGQNAYDLETLRYVGVKARQWQLIPGSGVDTETFTPSPVEDANGPVRFLFIGRMLIDKGLEELFSAWQQIHQLLPHAQLELLGEFDAGHPRCISKTVWKNGLSLPRVTSHGYHDDVRPFIQKASVIVLPSYREGIPRSLLEALAMGRPVIATDVAGCRELAIPNKTGWRIPAHSSAALAEALLEAYRLDNTERKQFGLTGRKLVEEGYSETIVAGQYLGLIEEVLQEAQCRISPTFASSKKALNVQKRNAG